MPAEIKALLLMYGVAIAITSIIVTVYDKMAAKRNPKGRIRERNLLLLGALGGALPMIVTMIAIQHKTSKPKFMLGLPPMIMLHTAFLIYLYLQF